MRKQNGQSKAESHSLGLRSTNMLNYFVLVTVETDSRKGEKFDF